MQVGVYIGGCLKINSLSDVKLHKIFSQDLLDNISNNLNHIKMLPLFLELGYDVEDFQDDYYLDKGKNEDFHLLQKGFCFDSYKGLVYLDKAIDCYIGIYFSAKACPNKSFDYSKFYADLKNIDMHLFVILENYFEDWLKYDYTDKFGSYQDITYNFMSILKSWCEDKIIISVGEV
ncbi:hypothetical protein DVK85_11050 [Flavobacterium arcticum]|uniref:Uncharacterized protein n=1 Tax=Flavobacterium arcticum TaxID=1784713 RepID=A0A345HDS8_9FLAO|nr:hypothetical protein [Flavobacterium arcticum]AXG74738.1 hypothetical protein DVK85_11050 [Flavobacterium arcticum]KAF2509762.1 hypothetical protein E0W72_09625 [Flavobacterium arcticum]